LQPLRLLHVAREQLVLIMLVINLAWHERPGVMQSPTGAALI
jgi:hypothetical protein